MSTDLEPGVYLEAHKATAYPTDPIQLCIIVVNEGGGGHGYRIRGPKYGAAGSLLLFRHKLTAADAREIRSFLDKVPGW